MMALAAGAVQAHGGRRVGSHATGVTHVVSKKSAGPVAGSPANINNPFIASRSMFITLVGLV
jgi:hypothetical protein